MGLVNVGLSNVFISFIHGVICLDSFHQFSALSLQFINRNSFFFVFWQHPHNSFEQNGLKWSFTLKAIIGSCWSLELFHVGSPSDQLKCRGWLYWWHGSVFGLHQLFLLDSFFEQFTQFGDLIFKLALTKLFRLVIVTVVVWFKHNIMQTQHSQCKY